MERRAALPLTADTDLPAPADAALSGTAGEPSGFTRFESAYQRLKSDIISGTYSPNQRLVEIDLTKTLEVSRPTVRAVLVRLQQDGLIELEANRGARVRSFSLAEAIEVLKVREVLEGLGAALAAQEATQAQLDELGRTVDEMARAVQGNDLLRYPMLNGRFHALIQSAARNPTLDRALVSLFFPLIRYRFRLVMVPGRKEQSLEEHRQIYECLRRRDSAGAERAAREHVARVRDVLGAAAEAPTC
jgi:DNA-binding GntR family transcriptional regulator